MRGRAGEQPQLFYAIDLEERIRDDRPLRPLKRVVDEILSSMSGLFARAYSGKGRPSVPPERLLKALLLTTLYTVRSERQLVERIDADPLFRRFLDMDPQEPAFDATTVTHNRGRLQEHGLIAAFLDAVLDRAIDEGPTSDDHFSVDGTMTEAYGSTKGFRPIEEQTGDDKDRSKGDKPGGDGFKSRNAEVDFHGRKRSNKTHRSTTDPEARLHKKAKGRPAKLSHMGHAVIENRNGPVMAVDVTEADGTAERTAAVDMIDRMTQRHGVVAKTMAGDKGYHAGDYYLDLEERGVTPHSAMPDAQPGDPKNVEDDDRPAYDARERMRRRQRTPGYRMSQRARKKVEEVFGWGKTIGGVARSRFAERRKLGQQMQLVGAACNLLRMRRLLRRRDERTTTAAQVVPFQPNPLATAA